MTADLPRSISRFLNTKTALLIIAGLFLLSVPTANVFTDSPELSAVLERSLSVGSGRELSRGSYGTGARITFTPNFLEFSPVFALGIPLDLGAGIQLPLPDSVQAIIYQKAGAGAQLRFRGSPALRFTLDIQGGAYLRQVRYLRYGDTENSSVVNSYMEAGPGLELSFPRRQKSDLKFILRVNPGYGLLFARDTNASYISLRIFSGLTW